MVCNNVLIAVAAATAVLGFAAAAYPAVPQAATVLPQANEQIIIEAPRYVLKRLAVPGRKYNLMNAEVASISHPVGYAVLDLSKVEDAATLRKRAKPVTNSFGAIRSRSPRR